MPRLASVLGEGARPCSWRNRALTGPELSAQSCAGHSTTWYAAAHATYSEPPRRFREIMSRDN